MALAHTLHSKLHMRNLLFILGFLLTGEQMQAFTVSVPLDTPEILLPLGFAAGSTSGHEEITRQAMNRLEVTLKSIGIDAEALTPEFLGDREVDIVATNGFTSTNMIIQGNYATDIPGGLIEIYDVPKWHGQPLEGWTNNPNVQVLHFLQNMNADGSLVSQYETCNLAKEQIIKSTLEGMRLWYAKDLKTGLFLFGHSTHTIQDSFSSAHTMRADINSNSDLLNICYYGAINNTGSNTCYHQFVDARDNIWVENPLDIFNQILVSIIPADEVKESKLKPEAVLARTATMRYLYLVATYLHENKKKYDESEVRKILNDNLFEGSTGMPAVDQGLANWDPNLPIPMVNGIIRCENLKKSLKTPLIVPTNPFVDHGT